MVVLEGLTFDGTNTIGLLLLGVTVRVWRRDSILYKRVRTSSCSFVSLVATMDRVGTICRTLDTRLHSWTLSAISDKLSRGVPAACIARIAFVGGGEGRQLNHSLRRSESSIGIVPTKDLMWRSSWDAVRSSSSTWDESCCSRVSSEDASRARTLELSDVV